MATKTMACTNPVEVLSYGKLGQYKVLANGSFIPLSPPYLDNNGSSDFWPQQVAQAPGKNFLYLNAGDKVVGFQIGAGGGLTQLPERRFPNFGQSQGNIFVDPTGRYIYVATYGMLDASQIATDGSLTYTVHDVTYKNGLVGPPPAISQWPTCNIMGLAFDQMSRFAYGVQEDGDNGQNVYEYRVFPNGTLHTVTKKALPVISQVPTMIALIAK